MERECDHEPPCPSWEPCPRRNPSPDFFDDWLSADGAFRLPQEGR